MAVELEALPRRWGNSLAIIIPAEIVEKQRISEREPVKITVEKKRPKAGVLWGYLKDWKTPTQQLKDEARAGWMSVTDRAQEEAWKKRMEKAKK